MKKDYFKTSDLSLGATLRYCGYSIEAIDKSNPSKVEFIIKRDDELDNIIQAFWTRQIQVEPINYFNFIKELKNRIYSN